MPGRLPRLKFVQNDVVDIAKRRGNKGPEPFGVLGNRVDGRADTLLLKAVQHLRCDRAEVTVVCVHPVHKQQIPEMRDTRSDRTNRDGIVVQQVVCAARVEKGPLPRGSNRHHFSVRSGGFGRNFYVRAIDAELRARGDDLAAVVVVAHDAYALGGDADPELGNVCRNVMRQPPAGEGFSQHIRKRLLRRPHVD